MSFAILGTFVIVASILILKQRKQGLPLKADLLNCLVIISGLGAGMVMLQDKLETFPYFLGIFFGFTFLHAAFHMLSCFKISDNGSGQTLFVSGSLTGLIIATAPLWVGLSGTLQGIVAFSLYVLLAGGLILERNHRGGDFPSIHFALGAIFLAKLSEPLVALNSLPSTFSTAWLMLMLVGTILAAIMFIRPIWQNETRFIKQDPVVFSVGIYLSAIGLFSYTLPLFQS